MNDLHTPLLDATVDVLDRLFALVRKVAIHGREHAEVSASACELEQALRLAQPPFALQLFPDAVLRDLEPVPLSVEGFRRCQQLVGACARWGVQELALDEVPRLEELIALADAVFAATHRDGGSRLPRVHGVRVRRLLRPGQGSPTPPAALDSRLEHQLERAYAEAELLLAGRSGDWPFARAEALCFRLERCLALGVTAAGRVLELGPGAFSPARRCVAATLRVSAVLLRLQASPLTLRASAHAALVLACHGFGARSGLPLPQAARAAWPRLIAEPDFPAPDPHRLRVCALLRSAINAEPPFDSAPTLPLIHAAYELERRRFPSELAIELGRAELQAWLASALGSEVHPGWGRALFGVLGLVPVGSPVLADGRLGVVAAPSEEGDPLRPRVLVGGELITPEQPVRFCSPLAP